MLVRRNNPVIDYGPLGLGDFKVKKHRFIWQGRVIWYFCVDIKKIKKH
jgi:hypothetical protein